MAAPRRATPTARSSKSFTLSPITRSPFDEEQSAEIAGLLSVLADPIRLRLLSIVAASGELCSCDLEGLVDRTQPTISHHTRVLAEAGLLTGERRGRWTYWRVTASRRTAIETLLNAAEVCTSAVNEQRPRAADGS
jgi:ArsR family transcriptional regulator